MVVRWVRFADVEGASQIFGVGFFLVLVYLWSFADFFREIKHGSLVDELELVLGYRY